eukprot:TRINITY_DN3409_c0_g1_i1.p1 TRINITY_DN3409_c0_g1~~TRINITY_DN3409_c0_g1_i1.p1  ORF type:complete len:113 (-),score=27.94 TRINITY_DN3409_c0_g1_i1:95-433(-)
MFDPLTPQGASIQLPRSDSHRVQQQTQDASQWLIDHSFFKETGTFTRGEPDIVDSLDKYGLNSAEEGVPGVPRSTKKKKKMRKKKKRKRKKRKKSQTASPATASKLEVVLHW